MAIRDEASQKTEVGFDKHNRETGLGKVLPFSNDSSRPHSRDLSASMANDLLTKPESSSVDTAPETVGHEFDAFLGKAIDEKPIWAVLYENLRDALFPPKLPPLELTSKPIPVPDPMAVQRSPLSIAVSVGFNVIILALVVFFGGRRIAEEVAKTELTPLDVGSADLITPKMKSVAGGGGGGGSNDIIPASKGKLPKLEPTPIAPPQVPKIERPTLPMDAAIAIQKEIQLPTNPMPNIGVTSSPNVTLASNGTGSSGGMGSGDHGGLGSGSGGGYGPGSGGNFGGGVESIGGDVSAPKCIYQPEAEFSEEARRAKYQGAVLVTLIVDKDGNAQDVRVLRPIGYGLDEQAVKAVRLYKFKPANKVGKGPVAVRLNYLVNFHMF